MRVSLGFYVSRTGGWGRNGHNPAHCPDLSRAAASRLLYCPNTLQCAGNSERGKRNFRNNDACTTTDCVTPAHDTRGFTRGERGGRHFSNIPHNPFTTQGPVFGDTRPQVYLVASPQSLFLSFDYSCISWHIVLIIFLPFNPSYLMPPHHSICHVEGCLLRGAT